MRAALALIAMLALAGCSSTHTLTGSFVLSDPKVNWTPTSCEGTGGYSDISEGLSLTVKDGAGKTIATGRLVGDPKGSSAARCAYTFSLSVPDSDFYAIEAGHRGELTYSLEELEAQGWTVGFTLGG